MKNKIIQNDIMRYSKNKASGNLALLGLAFNCIYFMVMYAQVANNREAIFNNGTPVYTILTGLSVIINLVILLTVFLASEELKGYNKKFCYVVWVVAAVQIIRIFGYPMTTYSTQLSSGRYIFREGTFIALLIFLCASAASLIAAGVLGFIRSTRLQNYKKSLENGEVDLEGALNEDEAPAVAESVAEPAENAEVR